MSGLPAEAEVPRTSFTVRSFSLLYRNPEDSRSKESLLAMRADAKRGWLHKKACAILRLGNACGR